MRIGWYFVDIQTIFDLNSKTHLIDLLNPIAPGKFVHNLLAKFVKIDAPRIIRNDTTLRLLLLWQMDIVIAVCQLQKLLWTLAGIF